MGFFSDIASGNFSSAFGGVESFLEDPLGVGAQIQGLESAFGLESGAIQQALALQQQVLGAFGPTRELAAEQIPLLREEALAEPGTSPLFQRGLQRGQAQIQQAFGPRGLAGSSAEALATGELGAGLLAQDIGRISGLRERLAGGVGAGFGQAAGIQGLLAQLQAQQAQTAAGMGAVTGAGRFGVTQALLDLLGQGVGALGTAATGVPTGAGSSGVGSSGVGSAFG
jgi:hypothetical protein